MDRRVNANSTFLAQGVDHRKHSSQTQLLNEGSSPSSYPSSNPTNKVDKIINLENEMEITKISNPNPYAGCYSLELYCDHLNDDHVYNEFPHTYTNEFGSACRSIARSEGWIIHRNNTATCPKCSGIKKAFEP